MAAILPAPNAAPDICRVALISTPRSGNTWVTNMVAKAFELTEMWAHSPSEVDWAGLPTRAVLQLHWQRTPEFLELLKSHGFRVVVMSRHPLDVLISILAYCQHDGSTLNWLAGAGGDERCLSGAAPLSEPFLNYATGSRATALLGVSREWWRGEEVCAVRYEDLLENTLGQMERVVAAIGQPVRVPLAEVVEQLRPSATRQISVQFLFHVWSAEAGLWRQLLTAGLARRIYETHREVFETLGYECRPDESLTPAAAQTTWDRLDFAGLKRNVYGLKRRMQECELREHADVINLHEELHRIDQRVNGVDQRFSALDQCVNQEMRRLDSQISENFGLHSQLADIVGNLFTRVEQQPSERDKVIEAILVSRVDKLQFEHDQLARKQQAEQDKLVEKLQAERDQLLEMVHALQARLQVLDGLGPWSVNTARRLQFWSHRFPTISTAMKSIATRFSHSGHDKPDPTLTATANHD